jgi:hypothetical protein
MNFEKTKIKNKPYSPDAIINDIKNMAAQATEKKLQEAEKKLPLPFYVRFGNSGEWAVHEDDGCLFFILSGIQDLIRPLNISGKKLGILLRVKGIR